VYDSFTRRLAPLTGIIILWAFSPLAYGNTARMLPAGVANVRYQYTVGYADQGFDMSGHRKSLGELYGAALNANGLTTSLPSVYHVDTGGKVDFVRHDIYLQYGVTNNFNLGLWAHYIDQNVSYSANLVREANWSALSASTRAALGAAVTRADTADTSAADWGDTVIGYKQRLVGNNKSKFRFAYYLGVRLPTGHVANPLRRGDSSTGGGQSDIGLWFSVDWQPTPRWLLNIHTRHEYQLAGRRNVLDPSDSNRVLSQRFQPGFYNYLQFMGRYTVPGPTYKTEFELSAIYTHTAKERAQSYDAASDSYRGGLHTVDATQSALLTLQPQIGIDIFPFDIKLYAGIPVAGRNTAALQYVGLRFDAYW